MNIGAPRAGSRPPGRGRASIRRASPLQRAIGAENERRYRDALARLSSRDQQLIVAHFDLDYTHAQLGCMIGRSPHAARMALTRAIGRLAARMRD